MDVSSERRRRGEQMERAEENGGEIEMEDVGRDSGKHHRSKDRSRKERREGRDHGSRRERERDDSDRRERRKVEDREDKDREREKERSRDKGHDRDGKHREKECNREREVDRERERSYDRERERSKERGKDKAREHEKDRDAERERTVEREHERGKEREKAHDHGRDREKDRERDRDRERSKLRERDNEKEPERERGREKDHERGKYRDKDREEWDRNNEREREKEKSKDREREKEKEKERMEREKGKEKVSDKDKDRSLEGNRDRSRTRDREREISWVREGEEGEMPKLEGEDKKAVMELVKESDGDDVDAHEVVVSKKHNHNLVASQLPTSEIEERITKMKEERLKKKSDGASEILSWVNKSRKLGERRISEKEKAVRLMKALEEQDNIHDESEEEVASERTEKHLAGVKILHGLDKVLEGGTVVLTLKDQGILADGDVNEEADMLENVEIGEQKRRDEAYRASKKRTGLYDDKFSEVADSQKAILPQYDEPTGDEGVTLDESGRFAGEAEKKLEELRRRIQGNSISKNFEDLRSSGKSLSDYYTPEEMLEFKKPKKRKSLRKKEKFDLDALEAEAKSAGLGIGDLGSRNDGNRLSAKEEKEKADAQSRSNAYESAFAKAQEASKVLQQEERDTIKAEEDDSPVFGEDYEDLQRSLEQARKLALSRQVEAAASGPQAIALEVKSKNVDADIHTSGELQENRVVITEMEEFVLGLQFNEDAHRPESEDVFMDVEEVPKTFVGDEKDEAGGWSELKETTDDEPAVDEEKEDTVQDETTHEVVVGKGLSGALKLLQERGTLKETVEWGGRTMDKKKSKLVGILDNEGSKEIRIERTDEFGRIMTPKEAFRILSHKFHGKGPGKAKQEKRMKQYEEELKLKQMKASDTPSMSVERMREAQARLKTPYLVLSGHVKPGQTSDPRSGFATVEKDNLGSLTPMLGDRKVEHFLGIKRKNDSSGMGPPPPKKPKS